MQRVLVAISIDAVGAARLPRLLADSGCEVSVVSGQGLSILSSRSVHHHVRTGRSPAEVRAGLEAELTRNSGFYSLVIIADEPLLRLFLDHPPVAELARLVPLTADPQRLAGILSKVSFTEDAAKAGIAVPEFRVIGSRDELMGEEWSGEPFVLKKEASLSGSGVMVIRGADDLEAAKADRDSGPILRQHFLTGKVGATSVLFDHGVPKCWFSYFLRRNWPNALASASAIEIFWHSDIEPMLVKLGKLTEFHGFCGVDWILDENRDQPLVLEVNPRPTPGLYLSAAAGVSFALAIGDWLRGASTVQRPSENAGGLHRMFPQNLFRAIDDREASEFVRTWMDAPWTDPGLLFAQSRRVATHYLPLSMRSRLKGWLRS
jgi:glutathione synthase/RimK-type ligase-like ATP-grasp enzyme